MTSLLLVLLLTTAPETESDAQRATSELFRAIPREVGAIAVLEDLDGFLTRIEQADVVKRLRRSKLLGAAVEQEVVRRWREIDGSVKARMGFGLDTLRKDVFGLSVALAYWPKAGGPKDEAGLLLVRARSAERLEELLHTLFRIQGGEPPKRTHAGVPYWTARDGERPQFLLTLGPIGLLTDDEEAVQRVIQASKDNQSWANDAVVAAMRRSTPTGALVSVFMLPRNFDARLPGKMGAKPGEAIIRESVAGVWKSVDWVSATAHVEAQLQFGLHASVDSNRLPPSLGKVVPPGAGPVPTQGLGGTVASFVGAADFGAIADLVGRLSIESNPNDAAAASRFIHSLFMGADRARDLVKQVGPRFGLAVMESAGPSPDAVFALELRPGDAPRGAVTNAELVEQALRFAALVLTFEANKNGGEKWELQTETVGVARVHVARGGRNMPPGVEPCFTVHGGWILAASSPAALKTAIGPKRAETAGEFGRVDLSAARRTFERVGAISASTNPQGSAFLDALADAVPEVLLKEEAHGPVHHWTVELPPPKKVE